MVRRAEYTSCEECYDEGNIIVPYFLMRVKHSYSLKVYAFRWEILLWGCADFPTPLQTVWKVQIPD